MRSLKLAAIPTFTGTPTALLSGVVEATLGGSLSSSFEDDEHAEAINSRGTANR
jgi:hypothetical protein